MKTDHPKRILIIGAGAIGGYVGGSLCALGHSVSLLCRPATADAVRKHGLHVKSQGADLHVHPDVFETPEPVFADGEIDLAIVAVKRYDTTAVVGPLSAWSHRIDWVLSLQNGIGSENQLAGLLGRERVLPGTVTTAVRRADRNTVVVEKLRGVGIAGSDRSAAAWAAEFDRAGLNCRLFQRALDMEWSKLLTNLVANPTSAILDMPPPEIFAHKGLFRLEILQLREALAVMRALSARVVDLPGTPVRILAFIAGRLPLSAARLLLRRGLGGGRGGKMPSFHADLRRGDGCSEIGYYHGAVVRAADRLRIPVPVNRLLTEIFTDILKNRIPTDSYSRLPEKLLDHLRT